MRHITFLNAKTHLLRRGDIIVKTKIVCTLGPGTESQAMLNKLVLNGMDVARINLSHGDLKQYEGMIKRLRKASKNVALLLDTKGPEIRTIMVKKGTVLKAGQTFTLTTKKLMGDDKRVSITYHKLPNAAKVGDKIMIDNGMIELEVKKKTATDIICKVIHGSALGDQKGVNHPNGASTLPSLTKHDKESIRLGMKYGLDFIALSFVRTPKDVLAVRKFIGKHPIQIIAKIEAAQGVRNFDKILEVADGVMVARGDLGIEIPTEHVPLTQKMIIRKCNEAGKPVITATQMLESMVNSPRPTRAEASDVANAILDGTDAVMMSEETAIGKYPMHSVRMMGRIASAVEDSDHRNHIPVNTADDAIAKAVLEISLVTKIKNILVVTKSGFSARAISKFRPDAEIITTTPEQQTFRQLSVVWGVQPLHCPSKIKTTRELIHTSLARAVDAKLLEKKDRVIVVAASPLTKRGHTNMIEVKHVGEWMARLRKK